MRYIKKFLLVGFITSILILSFSMSASAFTLQDTYDYNFGDSWHGMFHTPNVGERLIQVFYLDTNGRPCYVESFYKLVDSGGAIVPINNVHYAFDSSGGAMWLTLYWGQAGQFSNCTLSNIQYEYNSNGVLQSTRTATFAYIHPYSNSYVPCGIEPYTGTMHNFSCSQYAVPWGTGFLTGGVPVYLASGSGLRFNASNPLGFNFTINGEDPSDDDDVGDGGEGGSQCNCPNYEEYLIDIITNQESQLTKLNQIISILQNFNNDDVVSAVNDAVDDVINSSPGSSPPEALDPDDFPDKESDLLDDLPGIDDNDVDSISDHVSLDSDAIAWWYERFIDVTSNTKFRAVMLTMLSLAVIGFVLNKRGVL